MTPFALAIRSKRNDMGLSVPALSRLSGVHPAIIYRLEHDMYAADKNRWLLIEALNIPFSNETFSKKVRKKREKLGWTLLQLSTTAKVSASVISLIESKKKLPSMALCYKLAKTLQLSLEEFLSHTNS